MIYSTYQEAQAAMTTTDSLLSDVQQALYSSYEMIVKLYGQFDWGVGAHGSHYGPGDSNPFKSEGLICANCVFYQGGACEIVQGSIDPNGICKLWIIPESKLS